MVSLALAFAGAVKTAPRDIWSEALLHTVPSWGRSSMSAQRPVWNRLGNPAPIASPWSWFGPQLHGVVSRGAEGEQGTQRRGLLAKYDDDLNLVERMLAGEEQAFDLFGERCFKAVYRFTLARLRGDRDLAQEVVQTAMVKALSKLDTYRGESSLVTWLCSCCHNEMLMHFRRERTARPEVELDEEMEIAPGATSLTTGDAEAALLVREGVELVHMALDQLPDQYSRVLEWMYIERVPVKEIASRLGVHDKAAESLLTRARGAFRTSYTNLKDGEALRPRTTG